MINYNSVILDSCYINGIKIFIVRDDIYPFIGGGSKARKAIAYEKFMRENNYNAAVTCGGIQSNHNRAIALMCARNNWSCHLCIQGTEDRYNKEKGNLLLNKLSGAKCELIHPEETSTAMNLAINHYIKLGKNPLYIHGGGHDLPGGTCFVDAIKDLKNKCDNIGYKPDYIFLASGTGSTQAGIIVGLDLVGWSDVKCIGISVARQQDRGKKIVIDFANMLAQNYGIEKDYYNSVNFNTDYLHSGYETYSPEMLNFIESTIKETGIIFDTTYSGKALYGMINIINSCDIYNKNIIFWHTGGIMNILK